MKISTPILLPLFWWGREYRDFCNIGLAFSERAYQLSIFFGWFFRIAIRQMKWLLPAVVYLHHYLKCVFLYFLRKWIVILYMYARDPKHDLAVHTAITDNSMQKYMYQYIKSFFCSHYATAASIVLSSRLAPLHNDTLYMYIHLKWYLFIVSVIRCCNVMFGLINPLSFDHTDCTM